ncbi:MAG: 3-dehydroquinate synthase [Thaumarchaeota archaeon]|nr:3-dehydroquinate synthase [Nitrososphaerota archaeon]
MVQAALDLSFPRSSQRCSIYLGARLLEEITRAEVGSSSSFAIITDDRVARLYEKRLSKTLSGIAPTHTIVIPHGERNKTLDNVSHTAAKMSRFGCDRKTVLIALGGGVVGDLGGFVASVFKRGLKYFQVPTTLLAMVDSSIGGKTGVDTDWGKNQLGSFYQPSGIFMDTSTLDTLPAGELINGVAEMAKSAIIADRNLLSKLDSALSEPAVIEELKPLIKDTCKIKMGVVQRDEFEQNVRAILNYGHTVGHALEASSDFKLSHGKSVILGMICEGWISRKMGIFRESEYNKQVELIARIRTRFKIQSLIDTKKVLSFARLDKKTSEGTLQMSLPEEIGKMHVSEDGKYTVPVSSELFLESLSQIR